LEDDTRRVSLMVGALLPMAPPVTGRLDGQTAIHNLAAALTLVPKDELLAAWQLLAMYRGDTPRPDDWSSIGDSAAEQVRDRLDGIRAGTITR
jgi:hypothetical protein